ncbi:phosphonopyruvate decarboxylase [Agrobacterium vitis]|uniref:phosphonopyruvate decarboxylase n=1 Tax=Agrobacterium vitis TaxID=373 RepID=UPI0012E747CC|nr:phosphonopyruvate decarboxylase [Agrobacterium vitis]MVA35924.1 phosphonopyruvate decarboxylase [Agrobacterium vitis]
MITGSSFIDAAVEQNFDFFVSVPCSYLTPLLNSALNHSSISHVMATGEGEAIGIAAGAYLAGKHPVVMMQNSGLGNAVNPLSSLNHIFKIPSLIICSWRGSPNVPDEPQHQLMGKITHTLFDTLGIRHQPFPKTEEEILPALKAAKLHMQREKLPYAFIVEPNSICDEVLRAPKTARELKLEVPDECYMASDPISRIDVLKSIVRAAPHDSALIATTGKTGRELFTISDDQRSLYLVGSMGCASAVGLGVALNTTKKIFVIDGDGAALMKLGNFATIGHYSPKNLVHILVDNGVHESTGGQPTSSGNVNFAKVAAACGYGWSQRCSDLVTFEAQVAQAIASDGPYFIQVGVKPGSLPNLARPTISPQDVATRFMTHLVGAEPVSQHSHYGDAQ